MPSLTMTGWQWVTFGFVMFITVIVVGYDVWTMEVHGVNSSISRVLRALFTASPAFFAAIIFWLGVLIGHAFLATE